MNVFSSALEVFSRSMLFLSTRGVVFVESNNFGCSWETMLNLSKLNLRHLRGFEKVQRWIILDLSFELTYFSWNRSCTVLILVTRLSSKCSVYYSCVSSLSLSFENLSYLLLLIKYHCAGWILKSIFIQIHPSFRINLFSCVMITLK